MTVHQPKYKKYQGSLISSLLLIGAICTLVWGILPGIRNIRTVISTVTELRREVNDLQRRLAFLDGLNEDELRESLVELLLGVPLGRSVPTLLATILDVSSKSQVNLTDFTVDNPNALSTESATIVEETLEVPVRITLDSDEPSLRSFLTEIQNVRRILGIWQIDVTYDDSGALVTNLTLNGYSKPMLVGGIATDSASLRAITPEQQAVITKVSSIPAYGNDLPQAPVAPSDAKPDPFQRF